MSVPHSANGKENASITRCNFVGGSEERFGRAGLEPGFGETNFGENLLLCEEERIDELVHPRCIEALNHWFIENKTRTTQ
jgi:hypothetical protein